MTAARSRPRPSGARTARRSVSGVRGSSCASTSAPATRSSSRSCSRSSCSASSRSRSAPTATFRPRRASPRSRWRELYLPGMLAAGLLLSGLQNLAIDIAIEKDDGTLKRLGGTPLSPVSYFIGKIGQVLVTGILQAALLLTVRERRASASPCPPSPSSGSRSPGCSLLGVITSALLGIALSAVPRTGEERDGRRHPDRARAAVHLGRLPAFYAAARVAAERREPVPAQVDGAGHAGGVPARRVRRARAERRVEPGASRSRWPSGSSSGSSCQPAHLPLDPARRLSLGQDEHMSAAEMGPRIAPVGRSSPSSWAARPWRSRSFVDPDSGDRRAAVGSAGSAVGLVLLSYVLIARPATRSHPSRWRCPGLPGRRRGAAWRWRPSQRPSLAMLQTLVYPAGLGSSASRVAAASSARSSSPLAVFVGFAAGDGFSTRRHCCRRR